MVPVPVSFFFRVPGAVGFGFTGFCSLPEAANTSDSVFNLFPVVDDKFINMLAKPRPGMIRMILRYALQILKGGLQSVTALEFLSDDPELIAVLKLGHQIE